MIPNEFVQCFNRFFQLGTESFFKNTFDGFSRINNNLTPNRSSFQDNGRNNSTAVAINNRRLQWYDSNLQRALAPMPKGVPKSPHITKQELELLSTKIFDENKMNEFEITDCDICLGNFKNGCQIKVLPCKHSYHGQCIDKWLLQQPMCPRCRAGVKFGLRRELAKKKTVNNKIINNHSEQNESIEKRRKLFNEYYLKKRKKRLERLDAETSKCDTSKNCNAKQMNEKIKEETIETVTITKNPTTALLESRESISSPRLKAVEAALKRLELLKE